MVNNISIETIKYISHQLARDTIDWNEPIPEFDTRYPNILESCLITPFQKYDGKFMYQSLIERGAVLFYLLIKNHPFQNGNKRIAVTTLLIFLYLNKKWFKVDKVELYNFALWVAQSPPKLKDEVVGGIVKFIKMYLVDASK